MLYIIELIVEKIGVWCLGNKFVVIDWLLIDSCLLCFLEEIFFFVIFIKRNNGVCYIFDFYEWGVCNFVVISEDFKGFIMDSE